jgi:L-fucose isomerase-like protein
VLREYTSWKGVPRQAFANLVKLGVVLDQIIEEYGMDALSVRCWVEMQQQLGVSPCVLLSELNNRGIAAACEVDVGNAVTMHALRHASGKPAACLDWNNNYGEEPDKCILFHCGPVPQAMMSSTGQITDHAILANAVGKGCGYGCNTGRIAAAPFTYGSMLTEDGELCFYLGEGEFTADPIPDTFFGCAGVARIEALQEKLQTIGYLGHRHHTSVSVGHVAAPVVEAFEKYLGFDVTVL